jgi:hypothetical protein
LLKNIMARLPHARLPSVSKLGICERMFMGQM